jgi:ADP-ribosyl-[dinitrogen reductase] hydrolase
VHNSPHLKTSESSPLFIAEVGAGSIEGRIGITLCPGKRGPSLRSATTWQRDLAADLDVIRRWGAEVVVTLVEGWEMEKLGVADLGDRVRRAGLVWLHLPIVDGEPPGPGFELAWQDVGPRVHGTLADGGRVLVHCRGGLGRAGTVAARLLVESGADPLDAIAMVRRARQGAIETEAQRRYVERLGAGTGSDPDRDADPDAGSPGQWDREHRCMCEPRSGMPHYVGCLLGGAVGDALGASIEFSSLALIRAKHGPEGLQTMQFAYGRFGAFTDDTQMTLFTAEGLLDAIADGAVTMNAYVRAHHEASLRWLLTQGEEPLRHPDSRFPPAAQEGHAAAADPTVEGSSGQAVGRATHRAGAMNLLQIAALHSRRGPGGTCLSALGSGRMGTPENPLNDSKGCGGVMRMAPVGLFVRAPGLVPAPPTPEPAAPLCVADPAVLPHPVSTGVDPDEVAFELGSRCAAVTHGHPSGYQAAGALAHLISRLVAGDPLEAALRRAIRALRDHPQGDECAAALEGALAAWHSDRPITPETLESIGGGWVAEEALAVSMFCSLAAGGDFRRGVLLAANHSGDSDSTAAITGNIMGALLGLGSIPDEWVRQVELGDVVKKSAARLHDARGRMPHVGDAG